MNCQLKVSVIITTYGGDWKLIRAINSVLDQNYNMFEIIVIDDNDPQSLGRKNTEVIMQRYRTDDRVCYIKHEQNKNGAAARNTGIDFATGDIVCFLDDDDYILQNRLQHSVKWLTCNPELDGVCVSVAKIKSGSVDEIILVEDDKELKPRDLFVNQNVLGTGSNIFVKKDCILEIGGFDESFQRFQDVEFMIRYCEKFKVVFKDELLIAKDIAGYRTPNYKKIKDSFLFFCKKFEKQIEDLSKEDKYLFMNDRYSYLFSLAILGDNKDWVDDAKSELQTLRKLTFNEKFKSNTYSILRPFMSYRRWIAERDGLVVILYRKLKNSHKKRLMSSILLKNEQLSKEYYYRYSKNRE